MRGLVIAAMVLGLAIAADQTFMGSSRSQEAYRQADEAKWAGQPKGQGELPNPKLPSIRIQVSNWQIGSFLALGFLGCVAAWMTLLLFSHAASQPASLVRASLLGSILGALVIGTVFTSIFGVLFWFSELDRPRTYDRYEWEARWLVGALGGVVVGAMLGLIIGSLRRIRRA